MHKFYKQRLYKKYRDEIWGNLITSKKFSYNKSLILLNYKQTVLKRRLRIKNKFKYFRVGFLSYLNNTLFRLKNFRKKIRVYNFSKKKIWLSTLNSTTILRRRFRFSKFNKIKSVFFLNFLINNLNTNSSKKQTHPLLKPVILPTAHFRILDYSKIFLARKRVMYNSVNFLRSNNLQFIVKKKLNLKREKTFFYSIHIAAPRKKNKKWSLFALKNIYYKKISLFFGFKKIKDFMKLYNFNSKVFGRNFHSIFLMLEGRLSNFLLRLNIFPSLYFIKKFVQFGNVFVNNKTVNYSSYNLNFNEIVSFNKKYFKYFYYIIKSRLKKRSVLLNYPDFIEVDYKLFVAMLIRNPEITSLTSPVSFDLYTKFPTVNK